MNTKTLINRIRTKQTDSILYCFPESESDITDTRKVFQNIKFIQLPGEWVPNGTQTHFASALVTKYDVVIVSKIAPPDVLGAAKACVQKGGVLYLESELVGDALFKVECVQDDIYEYAKIEPVKKRRNKASKRKVDK